VGLGLPAIPFAAAYEFTSAQTGHLAAQAVTDWVYVTRRHCSQPWCRKRCSGHYHRKDHPKGSRRENASRQRPLLRPTCSPSPGRSKWHDIDMMWHVNNAVYLAYVEEAGARLAEAPRLVGGADDRGEISYSDPTSSHRIPPGGQDGRELDISTWYSDAKRATALRHCLIRRAEDRELLIQAQVHCAWVDLNTGHTSAPRTIGLRRIKWHWPSQNRCGKRPAAVWQWLLNSQTPRECRDSSCRGLGVSPISLFPPRVGDKGVEDQRSRARPWPDGRPD